jgi:putative ABC transport system permease protein
MFLFLGLPGLLLAGVLAAYAGAVLAATQRREHALLRLRGADRGQVRRMLLYRTVMLAGSGAVIGTLVGLIACAVVLGRSSIWSASLTSLAVSASLSVVAGLLVTGLALYLPSRRALDREVTGESRALAVDEDPPWRRHHLDLIAAGLTAVSAVAAQMLGLFEAPRGNVTHGVHSDLRSYMLLLPIAGWLAGITLGARLSEATAHRTPIPSPPRFGRTVPGLLSRTISRRSRQLFVGVLVTGLVVGIGTGLAVFASSYQQAKVADARFTVGSDLRVTPSPLSTRSHPASYAAGLAVVPGVSSVTPVVAGLENSTLRSDFNSDAYASAAIDPAGYARTANPPDELFVGTTAREALHALAGHPNNVLLDEEAAHFLELKVGDTAQLLMARGTSAQRMRTVHVVAIFTRLPAFPEGVNVVMNLGYYRAQTGLTDVDFFLASTRGTGHAASGVADAITAGPGARDRLSVDSTSTSVNRDESSLTSLNTAGLLRLDSFFTLMMSVAVIAIFVFAMILHRRKEYVVLAAQGLPAARVFALLLGETALVSLGGLLVGLAVGSGIGTLFVRVLTPLFILSPDVVFALSDLVRLVSLVLASMLLAAGAAYLMIRSLPPSEVLRDH